MKKEKTVRTYQRRTKSGKMVTVREHKASYDAAEEARKAAAKKAGAGSELSKKKAIKEENPLGFSEADYKEWYHWDMENDANNEAALRVEKALTKKMGKKAYNKYLEDMSNSYSARGHKKAHQSLLDEYTAQQKKQDAESSKAAKDIARGAKKKDAEAKASKVKEVKSSSTSGTYSVSYRGADGKTHVETFSDKESADDFRRNVAAGGYLPRGMFLLGRKEESKPTSAKTKSEVPKKFDYVMMHDGKDGRKGYRVSDGRIWTKGADGKMTEVKLSSLPKEIQRLYKENEKDFDRSKKKSEKTDKKKVRPVGSGTNGPEPKSHRSSESYATLKQFEGAPYRMRISKNGDPMPGEKQKLAKWKAGNKKLKEYLSTPEGAADKKSYVTKQKEKERKAEERRKRDVAKWREKYTAEKKAKKEKFDAKVSELKGKGFKAKKRVTTKYTSYLKGANTILDCFVSPDKKSAYVYRSGEESPTLRKATAKELKIIIGEAKAKKPTKMR